MSHRRWAILINAAALTVAPMVIASVASSDYFGLIGGIQAFVLSAFVIMLPVLLVRTWRGFFLLNLPFLVFAPAYAWHLKTFRSLPSDTALATLGGSDLGEIAGFLQIAHLWPFVLGCVAVLLIYISNALWLRRTELSPRIRPLFVYAMIPAVVVSTCLPFSMEDGRYVFSPIDSATQSILWPTQQERSLQPWGRRADCCLIGVSTPIACL